jgi:hypothetical protein
MSEIPELTIIVNMKTEQPEIGIIVEKEGRRTFEPATGEILTEVICRAEAYERLIKFLKTIEWIHVAFHEDDYFCPCCKRSKEDGHYKDCRLKQAFGDKL